MTTAQGENCTNCRQKQNWLWGVGIVVKIIDSILNARDSKISLNDINGERGGDTNRSVSFALWRKSCRKNRS